jgi:putative SbcD/Mre11-related phosphoesterase
MMRFPEIKKGIKIIDLTLYLEKQKTLVIPDVHIGYEEALAKQGYLVPRFHFKDLIKRTENIFSKLQEARLPVDQIILAGDVKHEFGTISEEEWRNTLKFLDFLSNRCKKRIGEKQKIPIKLIRGNHDTMLSPIAKRRDIEIVESVIIDDVMVCHGDRVLDVPNQVRTIIIGHEHPAITISDGVRSETYKCFIKGTWKKKTRGRIARTKYELIVMPSINPVNEGTDLLKEELLSPFLSQGIEDFDVFTVPQENHIMHFGKIKEVRKISARQKNI